MAKRKIPLEELYKDVPHFELIVKDGNIEIPSIFMFSGGMTEYYAFLQACREFNCTVYFKNEDMKINPTKESDTPRNIKEMLYFQMAVCPNMVEQYLRFLLNRDKMTWDMVQGQHEPILKD